MVYPCDSSNGGPGTAQFLGLRVQYCNGDYDRDNHCIINSNNDTIVQIDFKHGYRFDDGTLIITFSDLAFYGEVYRMQFD